MTTYHTVSWVRLMVVLENSRGGKNLLGNFFLYFCALHFLFVCLFFSFIRLAILLFFGDHLVIMGMNCIGKATKTFNVETSRSKMLRNTVYGCMVVD